MKTLVPSSQAAKILGISLQGIHYRIKKGQLESVKKEGKTFVYIEQKEIEKEESKQKTTLKTSSELIDAKNDQIRLLKKTIKFMKRQYGSEIQRLEKNQDKILNVFQSEVDLLKDAFSEMKNIYQVEHKEHQESQSEKLRSMVEARENRSSNDVKFMDVKDFFVFMKQHNKSDSQIKKIILEKVKTGDKRFIYDRQTKEVIIYKSDFLDLI